MKLLLLHQYFIFPSQAGSTRIYYLINKLIESGHKIILITGKKCRPFFENKKNNKVIKIYRASNQLKIISINDFYKQELTLVIRMLSFINFSIISLIVSFIIKKKDLVFASSTPLTIIIPAILYAKIKKVPFVLEIRDLWPDAPIQLGLIKNKAIIRITKMIERIAYLNASSIIGLSEGIVRRIKNKKYLIGKEIFFIPNGVDDNYFEDVERNNSKNNRLTVIYAGSCGYNNAIETIIEVMNIFNMSADNNLKKNVIFKIVGDGPALNEHKKNGVKNLLLLGKKSKLETIRLLKDADIALYPQRKIEQKDSIKKDSLPNKFFDYIGAGLPIVAAVDTEGEVAELLKTYKCGLYSKPESPTEMYSLLLELLGNDRMRNIMSDNALSLRSKYRRSTQMEKYVQILETVSEKWI